MLRHEVSYGKVVLAKNMNAIQVDATVYRASSTVRMEPACWLVGAAELPGFLMPQMVQF
jgi:hypothetical protein